MKGVNRNVIATTLVVASMTTLFTGCNLQKDSQEVSKGYTITQSELDSMTDMNDISSVISTISDSKSDTNFLKFWRENLLVSATAEQEYNKLIGTLTPVEGQKVFNDVFQVYTNKDGKRCIISFDKLVYLNEDGSIPQEALWNLRTEKDGKRIYTFATQAEKDVALGAIKIKDTYDGTDGERKLTDRKVLSSRDAEVHEKIANASYVMFNNQKGKESNHVVVDKGYINLSRLLNLAQEVGAIRNFHAETIEATQEDLKNTEWAGSYGVTKENILTGKLITASGEKDFEIIVEGITGKIKDATVGGTRFIFSKQLYEDATDGTETRDDFNNGGWQAIGVPAEDIQNVFGWDIDVYTEPKTGQSVLNFVSDTYDLAQPELMFVHETKVNTSKELTPEPDVVTVNTQSTGALDAVDLGDGATMSQSAYDLFKSEGLTDEQIKAKVLDINKEAEKRQEQKKANAEAFQAEEARMNKFIDDVYTQVYGLNRAEFNKLGLKELGDTVREKGNLRYYNDADGERFELSKNREVFKIFRPNADGAISVEDVSIPWG